MFFYRSHFLVHIFQCISLNFFFEGEISLIEGQTTSTIDIKEKQDTIKQG